MHYKQQRPAPQAFNKIEVKKFQGLNRLGVVKKFKLVKRNNKRQKRKEKAYKTL